MSATLVAPHFAAKYVRIHELLPYFKHDLIVVPVFKRQVLVICFIYKILRKGEKFKALKRGGCFNAFSFRRLS